MAHSQITMYTIHASVFYIMSVNYNYMYMFLKIA